jgi:hypothetical protein
MNITYSIVGKMDGGRTDEGKSIFDIDLIKGLKGIQTLLENLVYGNRFCCSYTNDSKAFLCPLGDRVGIEWLGGTRAESDMIWEEEEDARTGSTAGEGRL